MLEVILVNVIVIFVFVTLVRLKEKRTGACFTCRYIYIVIKFYLTNYSSGISLRENFIHNQVFRQVAGWMSCTTSAAHNSRLSS